MSDANSAAEELTPSEFVPRRFTIKGYHDQLLDKLAETRYASRSEALRAAITALSQSVLEDGETATEELMTEIGVLNSKIDNLTDKLEGIQSDPNARDRPLQKTPKATPRENGTPPPVSTTDLPSNAANEIYSAISGESPISHEDLIAATELNELQIRDGLDHLSERGFITGSTEGETTHYQVQETDL